MRTLLREPLVHFLVLGGLLFLFSAWRGGGAAGSRIVVSSGQVEHLASGFERTWMRAPSPQELKALVDEYVKEEIATREAVANGLDRDDSVIRKRLRQKLEFLAEDAVDQAAPTDADLQSWLDAHPDAYRVEPRIALRQVFVSRARAGARAPVEAARLLARLRAAGAGVEVGRLGDPTALPAELPLGPAREVALTFGDAFARAVDAATPGEWIGPVESVYGLHLVLVRERTAASQPALADVRPQVEREVITERRRQALDALYQGLLARYTVVVEPVAAPAAAKGQR